MIFIDNIIAIILIVFVGLILKTQYKEQEDKYKKIKKT